MIDDPRLPRILWAVTALFLLAGLIAIPVVGDDGGGSGDGADGGDVSAGAGADVATTSSAEDVAGDGGDAAPGSGETSPDGASATTGAPGTAGNPLRSSASSGASSEPAPTTTAASASPAATAPPENLGPPQDPGPSVPPKAGSYRYKATTAQGESEATTIIEDKGTTPTETRQLVRLRGEQMESDNDVAWRKDGVVVLSSEFSFGESRGSCDWEPDITQLKLPLAKGVTWESTGSCTATGFGAPVVIKRTVTGTVLELRRVRVAGQVVDVWAIDSGERIEFGGNVIDSRGTTLFSPKHGLVVARDGKATFTNAQGSRESATSSEIQNLDPE